MSSFDVLIRGGSVATPEGVTRADLGVADGRIALMAPEISGSAAEIVDASGLHIFPGIIDSHVHFNEPGRAGWEGIETGSAAVAAGGGAMFFDMPLNAHPPTLDAESFQVKQTAAEAKSLVDFALWGGLTPTNLDHMEALAKCGVIGFKTFMCPSGIDDFLHTDTSTLREGMKRAAALRRVVAVHAESEARLTPPAGPTPRDFLRSRPIEAELEAIRRAIDLAGETGCALHVVHVSCAAGVELIAEARKRGVDATCETCPHYLVLTEDDMERIGAAAKCAPPLRSKAESEALRAALLSGGIETIGSDHSPAPPDMKTDPDFRRVWGGISGAQHLLSLMITTGVAPAALARLLAGNVAKRFSLPATKGRIAVGADADLALVDIDKEFEVTRDALLCRHRLSPYVGRRLRGLTRRTFSRGRTVFRDGRVAGPPSGRLIRPVASC